MKTGYAKTVQKLVLKKRSNAIVPTHLFRPERKSRAASQNRGGVSRQHRRCEIFVESEPTPFPSSVGAAYSEDVAPDGAKIIFGFIFYKDVTPTAFQKVAAPFRLFPADLLPWEPGGRGAN